MLVVISPAKSLDMDSPSPIADHTVPTLLVQSQQLIDVLKQYSVDQVAQLMSISGKLAELNAQRYHDFMLPFSVNNAKQAVFAFNGDVYEGLSASSLDEASVSYLQQHLRILSGLYGVLRPLDLMQPYRLEMGTKLATDAGKDLYAFWGDAITQQLIDVLPENEVLVNLASEEYFSSVRPKVLQRRVVTPVFQDEKAGKYKIISFYAKKARGMMVRYAAEHKIVNVEDLKAFNVDGYAYVAELSSSDKWVFRRAESL